MSKPTVVALVGEDTTHAVLLGSLLRAVVGQAALAAGRGWIADNLEHDPVFHGDEDLGAVCPGLRYTSSIRIDLRDVDLLRIAGRRVKTRGFLDGRPQSPEAHKWRLILLKLLSAEPDVVLVAKDTDGDASRLAGLEQVLEFFRARDATRVIILAAPHQDAESWLVAGFDPDAPREHKALEVVCRELGFDPRQQPERLTAHPNDARTDAKRVLRRLLLLADDSLALTPDELAGNRDRLLGDVSRLERRGAGTGLRAFLDELQHRVVPVIVRGA